MEKKSQDEKSKNKVSPVVEEKDKKQREKRTRKKVQYFLKLF